MHLALLSEVGARTIYERLASRAGREDLGSLLERIAQDSERILERLRELMIELGGDPPRTSLRRRLLASALARLAPVIGIHRVLRLCEQAEETVSRWYAQYAVFLDRIGDAQRSRICQQLAAEKRLHAQALSAWNSNLVHLD